MKIKEKKISLAEIYKICPGAHILSGIGAVLILLHLAFRHERNLMAAMAEKVIRPFHRLVSQLCQTLSAWSVAEGLIIAFAALVLGIVLVELFRLFFRSGRLKTLYRLFMTLLSLSLLVYAGYSTLWGTYYYADDFMARSGFETGEISVNELRTVTEYFAQLVNEYAPQVNRDEQGCYQADKLALVNASHNLYENTQLKHPELSGPELRVKALKASRLLSYLDFTGFFFPFTGEACVNIDFPSAQFPATIAHELAHQRGVAREQDANFAAVLSCLESAQPDYCYSGSYLAYVHLGNALYTADYESWKEIYLGLDERVLRDMEADRVYWQQFETPVQTASNALHEGLLQSYEQDLGRKSYGACVDALVNYYLEAAENSRMEKFEKDS